MRLKSCAALLYRISNFNKQRGNISSQHSLVITIRRTFSQWHIVGAVCLERKPVITQPLTPLEEKYFQYIKKLEVEKSYLSDHEKKHIEDRRIVEKLKTGSLDDMDSAARQTAQDFEDACTEELNKYKPAPRQTLADINNDRKSTQRKLDSSLVFVIKQKLGNDYKWNLPQTVHREGETLRQTAERALNQVATCNSKVQFMGNAPVGYYKYKYPKAIRGNGFCGAKVFFFKAQLLGAKEDALTINNVDFVSDYLWLTHSELEEVLQPVLYKTVQSFLYPDTVVVDNGESQACDEEQIPSSVASQ